MVSDARKTDAQRFGNGKKGFSVKQVKDILTEIPTTEEMETALETKQDVLIAGTGIDITDDTISVDTTIIQEKLTAGDNITISNNVISASGGTAGEVWEEIAVSNLSSTTFNVGDRLKFIVKSLIPANLNNAPETWTTTPTTTFTTSYIDESSIAIETILTNSSTNAITTFVTNQYYINYMNFILGYSIHLDNNNKIYISKVGRGFNGAGIVSSASQLYSRDYPNYIVKIFKYTPPASE